MLDSKGVAIDVDGVLTDFTWSFTRLAKELGLVNQPWHCDRQLHWDFPFHVGKVWETIDSTPNWWATLEPALNDREVTLLNHAIHRYPVYFLTNRRDGTPGLSGLPVAEQTRLWMRGFGIDVDRATVIANVQDKGMLAHALDIEVAIDDHTHNLDLYRAACVPTVVCRRWKYNQHWDGLQAGSLEGFLQEYVLGDD